MSDTNGVDHSFAFFGQSEPEFCYPNSRSSSNEWIREIKVQQLCLVMASLMAVSVKGKILLHETKSSQN